MFFLWLSIGAIIAIIVFLYLINQPFKLYCNNEISDWVCTNCVYSILIAAIMILYTFVLLIPVDKLTGAMWVLGMAVTNGFFAPFVAAIITVLYKQYIKKRGFVCKESCKLDIVKLFLVSEFGILSVLFLIIACIEKFSLYNDYNSNLYIIQAILWSSFCFGSYWGFDSDINQVRHLLFYKEVPQMQIIGDKEIILDRLRLIYIPTACMVFVTFESYMNNISIAYVALGFSAVLLLLGLATFAFRNGIPGIREIVLFLVVFFVVGKSSKHHFKNMKYIISRKKNSFFIHIYEDVIVDSGNFELMSWNQPSCKKLHGGKRAVYIDAKNFLNKIRKDREKELCYARDKMKRI